MKTQTLLYSTAVLIQELYNEDHLTYDVYNSKMNELTDYCSKKVIEAEKQASDWSKLKVSILELSFKTKTIC